MDEILIVDDDRQLARSFEKILVHEGYMVNLASSGEEALQIIRHHLPGLVITDIRLPGMTGLETFKALREIDPKLPVIIMTAFGTTDTAIEATKLGAFDYVLKPFEIPDMLLMVTQALETGRLMRSRVLMDQTEIMSKDAIIGRSKAMNEIYKAIGRVAPTDATVLIRGESGTGKELVARAVYQHSLRANNPFLVINCVAIPETLLESELFGYEKGAFTGAANRRIGKIEQAHGGTIFLDEIGDMPMSIQAKILRLLQGKSIERLGGREPIGVDVRIIAATNRNLEAAMEESRFREDLYYRLNVVTLTLPPLRERREDIPLLTEYLLWVFSKKMGIPNTGITKEALAILDRQAWPGNVRELANAIEKCLIFSRGRPIGPDDIITQVLGADQKAAGDHEVLDESIRAWSRQALAAGGKNLLSALTNHVAGLIISEALIMTGGNRTRAAEFLGLSRPTLLAKIDKLNIHTETSVRID